MMHLCIIHLFLYSGYFCSLFKSTTRPILRGTPETARLPCRSFTPKRHRQLRVQDFPPNVAARAGFEPATLQTKGTESTNEPPRPTRFTRTVLDAPAHAYSQPSDSCRKLEDGMDYGESLCLELHRSREKGAVIFS